jgi:hypothetical protein
LYHSNINAIETQTFFRLLSFPQKDELETAVDDARYGDFSMPEPQRGGLLPPRRYRCAP